LRRVAQGVFRIGKSGDKAATPSARQGRPERRAIAVGVDPQLLVVGQRLLAPGDWVSEVVPQPVKELGETGAEVRQTGVHAHHVCQCSTEIPHGTPELRLRALLSGKCEVAHQVAWSGCRFSCAMVPIGTM